MDPFHRRDPLASDLRSCPSPPSADIGQGKDPGQSEGLAAAADIQIAGIASGRTDHRQTLPWPDGSNGR